jgi:predicted aconitase
MESNNAENLNVGKKITNLAEIIGVVQHMDEKNKQKLEDIKNCITFEKVQNELMNDNNGKQIDYFKSRMDYG